MAEAIAPCVLWLDEIEKGFAGGKSSGVTDGGTSARVLGSFLCWLQEKEAPVFVVATANEVALLPPEMLRKGRFDELFFVDLPDDRERSAIWEIQIRKYGRRPDAFDLGGLTGASEGFTGAEIEQAFAEALYAAFAEDREPGTVDLAKVLEKTVPLAKLMAEQVQSLRKWAAGRCRPASNIRQSPRQRRIAA